MNTTRRIFLIVFADGTFASSPLSERTGNPEMAGTFREVEQKQASQHAQALGGEAVAFVRDAASGRLVRA